MSNQIKHNFFGVMNSSTHDCEVFIATTPTRFEKNWKLYEPLLVDVVNLRLLKFNDVDENAGLWDSES